MLEAKEWVEPAPGGSSRSQIFRLDDGRHAVVKFPENPQGERVLVNELLCCSLAEELALPVNLARLVVIDERSLANPRKENKMPPNFTAGIRCGMIRYDNFEACQPADILKHCENANDLHGVVVFEQLVARGDGRQLLMYPPPNGEKKRFAAFDYGFAFGGSPQWTSVSIPSMPAPKLPENNPFDGTKYKDGSELQGIIGALRKLSIEQIDQVLKELYPPRWNATKEEVQSLLGVIENRAKILVKQFEDRYNPQMEMTQNVH